MSRHPRSRPKVQGPPVCANCAVILSDANWTASMQKYRRNICAPCWSKRQRGYEAARRAVDPTILEKRRERRAILKAGWSPERKRQDRRRIYNTWLQKNYGIGIEQYEAILDSQDSKCALCGSADPKGRGTFHVDHNHRTGELRGLLCTNCNMMLGLAEDDQGLLRRAIEYLQSYSPSVSRDTAAREARVAGKPIIFSAPMIRSLLAGNKSQTRRVFIPPKPFAQGDDITAQLATGVIVPRHSVGDRLWVKETYAVGNIYDGISPGQINPNGKLGWCGIRYAATDERFGIYDRNSMFMPRWASRLTLFVVGVRMQRLQAITDADAVAEGVQVDEGAFSSPRAAFAALWDNIHGRGAWIKNPWVTALTFEVCRSNIDAAVNEAFERAEARDG